MVQPLWLFKESLRKNVLICSFSSNLCKNFWSQSVIRIFYNVYFMNYGPSKCGINYKAWNAEGD